MKALGGPKDPSKDPALKAKVAKKPSNELSLSDLTSGVSRSPVKRFDPTEAVCDSNGLNKNHDQSNNVVCLFIFDDALFRQKHPSPEGGCRRQRRAGNTVSK